MRGHLRRCWLAGRLSFEVATDDGSALWIEGSVDAIAVELSPTYAPLPAFAAATGLRPEEWQPLERRDVDRRAAVLNVRRTVSSGEVVELGKTNRSRR